MRYAVAALLILLATAGGGAWAQDGGASGVEGGPGEAGVDGGAPPRGKAPPIPADRLPSVEASLGVEQVELGQIIPLTIIVRCVQGDDRVHLREARRFGPFELLGRRRREASDDQGPRDVMEIDLISFEVGQHEVPPIEMMVVLGDGRTGVVSTEPLSIEVTDPLGNEPDPTTRPDHSPRTVLTTDRRVLWIGGILGGLLLAAFLGAALGRLRERKRPAPEPPPPPPRPPEDVAFEKLDAIKRGGLLRDGEVKAFHVAVSEAIREYLGGRYGFDSLEMTTEELLDQLEAATVRGVTETELQVFLRETDMVKFAKWRPEEARSQELLEQAYEIVSRTTKAEEAYEVKSSIGDRGEHKATPKKEEEEREGGRR